MHGFYRILSAKVQILFQNSAKMQTNYLFFISYSYITDHMGTPCEIANVYGLTVSLPCKSLRINHGDM